MIFPARSGSHFTGSALGRTMGSRAYIPPIPPAPQHDDHCIISFCGINYRIAEISGRFIKLHQGWAGDDPQVEIHDMVTVDTSRIDWAEYCDERCSAWEFPSVM